MSARNLPPKDAACNTCWFGDHFRRMPHTEYQMKGICRRSPPVALSERTLFPEVSSTDWCGEYQARNQ